MKNKKLDEISIIKKNLGGLSIVMKGPKLIVEVCNNEIGKTFLNDPILENFKQVENDSIHSLVGSFELLENSFLFDFLVYFIDKYSFDVSLIKFC